MKKGIWARHQSPALRVRAPDYIEKLDCEIKSDAIRE